MPSDMWEISPLTATTTNPYGCNSPLRQIVYVLGYKEFVRKILEYNGEPGQSKMAQERIV